MAVNKRSKNSRQRGSHTHGWGSKKKHRGAGHRGGRGNAGTGKRADQNKPSIWKNKKYFGRYGFTSVNRKNVKAINMVMLESMLPKWISLKLIKGDNDTLTIDLKKFGFTKLLSNGKVTKKLTITVDAASAKAVEKVQAAGGSVQTSATE